MVPPYTSQAFEIIFLWLNFQVFKFVSGICLPLGPDWDSEKIKLIMRRQSWSMQTVEVAKLHVGNTFWGGSAVKESACNAEDRGSIPGLGRSPGEGNGYPLQYSCLKFQGQRRLAGCNSWHHKLLDRTVQFILSVVSDSLWPHESQHARPPYPSTPGVHPNSCPSSRWCHPAISFSVVLFSSFPQSLPASGSLPVS